MAVSTGKIDVAGIQGVILDIGKFLYELRRLNYIWPAQVSKKSKG